MRGRATAFLASAGIVAGFVGLVLLMMPAGSCSPARASGPVQTAIDLGPTLLDYLAVIGPVGVGLAALGGLAWKVWGKKS